MKRGQIWSVVGVALVVAVLASLVTTAITGNVISVAKGTAGKVYTVDEVYNKKEINNMYNALKQNKVDKWEIPVILNNFSIKIVDDSFFKNQNFSISCNKECGKIEKTCVGSFLFYFNGSERDGSFKAVSIPLSCSELVSMSTHGQLAGYSSIELYCSCL